MSNKRANRPSPSVSATAHPVGTVMTGNDGQSWKVTANSAGVKSWRPAPGAVPTPPVTQHVFSQNPSKNIGRPLIHVLKASFTHKFKVGDKVKIVAGGYGIHPKEVGKIATITNLDYYYDSKHPGYWIDDRTIDSNNINGEAIAEESFELLKEPAPAEPSTEGIIVTPELKEKLSKMSKVKTLTRKTAQEVRSIETSLINKEEVFRNLALAEATGLPLLLVGPPGTGKTKTVIEYAKAWLNRDGKMTAQDFANKIYILETDEGTKASEIKGMPSLDKLFTENKYELNAPIAEAEIVIINEVDKASSAIRNAMLGVMNEKFLFNGKHKIPCKWKLFVATCNEIPKEEQGSPFWDRFMLKHTVNRVSAGELVKYYSKGARNYKEKFNIGIPNKQEIDNVELPIVKMEKYLEVGYQHSSDRTLTFVPTLAKAVSFIWDISLDKAMVKTAQIMIGQSAGSELQNKLMSPEVKTVMSKVEMLHSFTTNEQLELAVAEIEALVNAYTTRGVMDEGQVTEIEMSMQYILANHPARVQDASEQDLEQMMAEVAESVSLDSSF